MTYYIGNPLNSTNKFFYKFTRSDDGYLTFTKVNLETGSEDVVDNINDLDFTLDDGSVVINIDENHELVNADGGHTQYKLKQTDILYFINDEGELILRVNGEYNYPTNV